MAKTVASKIQAALGQDGAYLVPATSYDNFYQPTEIQGIGGDWTELKQGAIANAPVEDPLEERLGVFISAPEESWELDVRRNVKELFSAFGAYQGGSPTNPEATVYQHLFELANPQTVTRLLFSRVYEDVDGVWFHRSCESNGFTFTGTDGYVQMSMPFVGASVTAAQHIPTASSGPVSYAGRAWIRKSSMDADSSALSYVAEVVDTGVLPSVGSAAGPTIKTKLSTGSFGAARPIWANKPFPVEDGSGTYVGLDLMLTRGTAGAANTLTAGDQWTFSTRGTAPTPTIPTGQTVFVPTNFEWTVLIGGAVPSKRPKTISITLDRGLGNDDYGWGSDETNSHPVRRGFTCTGSLVLETENLDYWRKALHFKTTSLKVTAEGAYVGSSVTYRQTFELELPLIQIKKFPRNLQKDRTPVVTIPFKALPSTPSGLDLIKGKIINTLSTLST